MRDARTASMSRGKSWLRRVRQVDMGPRIALSLLLGVLVMGSGPASAQSEEVRLVSRGAPPAGTGSSQAVASGGVLGYRRAMSSDGHSIVYRNQSHPMLGGAASPVSRRLDLAWDDGLPSDAIAGTPVISADGNHVAFEAIADDLHPAVGVAAVTQLYRFDLRNGARRVVSVRNGLTSETDDCRCLPIGFSDDGEFLIVYSQQSKLAQGDPKSPLGWFLLHHLSDDTLRRVSGDRGVYSSSQSFADASAKWILAATRAADVVPGTVDSNDADDVILIDTAAGTSRLVSRAFDSTTRAANAESVPAGLSADGRHALVATRATDFSNAVLDANGEFDLYVIDLQDGGRELISRKGGAPDTASDAGAGDASLSADGRWVAFDSESTDLVPGFDSVGERQVYLHDRQANQTVPISRSLATGDGLVHGARVVSVSDGGQTVVFSSISLAAVSDATAATGEIQLFRYDRTTDSSTLVSRAHADRSQPAGWFSTELEIHLDAGGDRLAFDAASSSIVSVDANDEPDVFVARRVGADVVFRDGLEFF